ncbi:MAG TPA: type I-E CRISPR-associated protein Cas6/Cse3/CasE [Vicinamibacterales bacterium]|jgi:CRISPR-associated protein Cas6/Cse3/CasE, subtype I-E/ECOLI
MTDTMYLSRATLREDAPIAALHNVLVPKDESQRLSASHRLVWTLFGDTPDRDRDFLWREASPGTFYLLSCRTPVDQHRIFKLDEPKLFAPSFAMGDRVTFALRANATVAKKTGGATRGAPCDVVMNALHAIPKERRAIERARVAEEAGRAWLSRQGAGAGFRLVDVPAVQGGETSECAPVVSAYRTLRLDRDRRGGGFDGRLGILDFEGMLEITDPSVFMPAMARGFGRAKAFGCGLMLIRPAQ